MYCSVYPVSLCCSVYCLCLNMHCTIAIRCQPNCSQQIYHILSVFVSYEEVHTVLPEGTSHNIAPLLCEWPLAFFLKISLAKTYCYKCTRWGQLTTGQATYVLTHSPNHCCCGKAISITYSECVSATLVIQHAKHMHYIMLSSVACLPLPHFSILCHKCSDFREKVMEYTKCIWTFSTIFIWNFCHSKKNWVRYYHKCTLVFM